MRYLRAPRIEYALQPGDLLLRVRWRHCLHACEHFLDVFETGLRLHFRNRRSNSIEYKLGPRARELDRRFAYAFGSLRKGDVVRIWAGGSAQ